LISVVFDNEVSLDGDLTRQATILLAVGEKVDGETQYRWRIPHAPGRPPFAIDVRTRPFPLPYNITLQEDQKGVTACTEIAVDLADCVPGSVHELRFAYSQDGYVDIVRRQAFSTTRTYVWSYTFVSETRYFETRVRFPRSANVKVRSGDTTLDARQRTAEIQGQKVYTYTHRQPRQGDRVNSRVTYRIWSPATVPTIAIVTGILVALPASFSAGVVVGLVTLGVSLTVTTVAHLLTRRFG
jgi:hypothetical protein